MHVSVCDTPWILPIERLELNCGAEGYRFYVGAKIAVDWQAAYEPYLRDHGLE
jgi:hypothetical protein